MSTRRKPWKRRIATGVVTAFALGLVSLASMFLATRSKPTWYDPPVVDGAMAEEARRSLPDAYQLFSDAIVAGDPFIFQLDEQTVNEWLAAREEMWPAASRVIPTQIDAPAVAFRDGVIALAARVKLGGIVTVVSVRSSAQPVDDRVVIDSITLLAGSLPMPLRAVSSIMDMSRASHVDLRSFSDPTDPSQPIDQWTDLFDGFAVRNFFYWANGERFFRITRIESANGLLTLGIEPVP